MSDNAYFQAADELVWSPFDAGRISYVRNDEKVIAGIWEVTPAEAPDVVEIPFPLDETLHVLTGRMEIEVVGGPTLEFGPGDSGSFRAGIMGRWRILEPLRQFFVYSH